MNEDVLRDRLEDYAVANTIEQENALQEIMQCFILAALAKAGFFEKAEFHGGTCLRIMYGMRRFSEDLDFLLKKPESGFAWAGYLESVAQDCALQEIDFVRIKL